MNACPHDPPRPHRTCTHLLAREQSYRVRFTGAGTAHELLCQTCEAADTEACDACAERVLSEGCSGRVGEPGILDASTSLRFELAPIAGDVPKLVALAPLAGGDHARWLGAAVDGIYAWDLDAGTARRICPLPANVDPAAGITLHASRDHRLAAIANTRGIHTAIVDLDTGAAIRELVRDGYHSEHCDQSLAFLARGDRTLLVHAPDWNRLDVIDPRTGEVLTERGPTSYTRDQPRPAHYLDYFHARLALSPGERAIADAGWVWQPCGIVSAWRIDRWLDGNVWESEDGPTRKQLTYSGYHWNGPMCWLDDERLAVWGWGEDDPLVPAARVFDAARGRELRWFAGPRGELATDGRVLLSLGEDGVGACAWDVDAGTRIASSTQPLLAYHPDARVGVGRDADGRAIVARLCGHHAAAAWITPVVRATAAAITHPDELPILGDALELAGCPDDALLAHCRAPGPHGSARCWALDRLR